MLFWGWGRKSLQRQVSPETTVVRSYRYLHLMFFFTVTWGYDYAIATLTPVGWATRPAPPLEARAMLNGEDLEPNFWKRDSLVLALAVVVVLLIGSALVR